MRAQVGQISFVYILFILNDFLTFSVARKVIRIMSNVDKEDVENEIRAIDKLCFQDARNLLVQVFHYQQGSTDLFPHDLYEIDMKLCDKNLRNEIDIQHPSIRELFIQRSALTKESFKFQEGSL